MDEYPGACIDRMIGNDLCVRQNYSGYQLATLRKNRPTAALFELQFKETPNSFVSRTDTMSQTLNNVLCLDIPLFEAGPNCQENFLEVRTLLYKSFI